MFGWHILFKKADCRILGIGNKTEYIAQNGKNYEGIPTANFEAYTSAFLTRSKAV